MKKLSKKLTALLMLVVLCTMPMMSSFADYYELDFNNTDGVLSYFKKNQPETGGSISVEGGKLQYIFSGNKWTDSTRTCYIFKQNLQLQQAFSVSMDILADKPAHLNGVVTFRDYYKEEGQVGFFNMVSFADGTMTFVDSSTAAVPSGEFRLEIIGSPETLNVLIDGETVSSIAMPTTFGYIHNQEFRLEFNNKGMKSGLFSAANGTVQIDNFKLDTDYRVPSNTLPLSEIVTKQYIQNFDNGMIQYFRQSGSNMSVSDGKLHFNFARADVNTATQTSYLCIQNLELQENFVLGTEITVSESADLSGYFLFRDYSSAQTGTAGFYNMITFTGGNMKFLNGQTLAIPTGTFRLKLIGNDKKITTYLNETPVNISSVSGFCYTHPQEIRLEFNSAGVGVGESADIQLDNIMFLTSNSVPNHVVADPMKFYVDYGRERIREEEYLDPYESMNVSVVLGNSTNEQKSVSLLDANGCLVEETELLPGEVKELILQKPSADVRKNEAFRFFLWDGTDTMLPVALPSELSNDGVLIPTIDTFKTMLSKAPVGKIWMSDEKVAEMKGYLDKNSATYDENFAHYWAEVLKEADATLKHAVQTFGTSFGVQSANRVYDRTALMSTVYKVTGDTRYADYARRQMLTAAGFTHWNHEVSFLETAAVLSGLAIGYDCLKDVYLTDEEERIIEKALYEKGILPGLNIYRTGVDTWDTRTTNWNVICNGGMGSAALAIGYLDKYRDDCAEALNTALRNFRKVFHRYTSKGSWHEGPGYWSYMLQNSVDFQQMLLNAYGTNFGYEQFAPFMQTGYYAVAMNGAQNNFNYNDCTGDAILSSPRFFFFADIFGDNALGAYHVKQLETHTATYRDAIWYDSKFASASMGSLNFDFYDDELKIGSFRDNFTANTYLAWSADDNLTPHSQNDMGNFVYDADGVRWFEDLGTDEYTLYEFLSYYSYKWYYYRNRAEGHNCMIFAPGKYNPADYHTAPDQIYDAIGEIKSVRYDKTDYSSVTMDLTDAYRNDCESYQRSLALDKTTSALLVKDQMKLAKDTETYWFAHTKGEINVSEDGKSAVITRVDNGETKQLYVEILKGEGTFEVLDAVPLPTSPQADELPYNVEHGLKQNPNQGITKLSVHTTRAAGDNELVIGAVPLKNKARLTEALNRVGF